MTLTKAIDMVREKVNTLLYQTKPICRGLYDGGGYTFSISGLNEAIDGIEKALAALPDKPMTEREITRIIAKALQEISGNGDPTGYWEEYGAPKILSALKSANVLFVDEE